MLGYICSDGLMEIVYTPLGRCCLAVRCVLGALQCGIRAMLHECSSTLLQHVIAYFHSCSKSLQPGYLLSLLLVHHAMLPVITDPQAVLSSHLGMVRGFIAVLISQVANSKLSRRLWRSLCSATTGRPRACGTSYGENFCMLLNRRVHRLQLLILVVEEKLFSAQHRRRGTTIMLHTCSKRNVTCASRPYCLMHGQLSSSVWQMCWRCAACIF